MNLARLSPLLLQLPVILAWAIGIILALVFWSRHPTVSLLVLVGIALLVLNLLLGRSGLPLLRAAGEQARRGGLTREAVTIVRSLINALGFAALLAAAFIARRPGRVSGP
jgi:hypothetical protein